jgi:hypothetical protein
MSVWSSVRRSVRIFFDKMYRINIK